MKITIIVGSVDVSIVKRDNAGVGSTLLIADYNAQSVQEIAALAAKIVGTEVAAAITAATGGE